MHGSPGASGKHARAQPNGGSLKKHLHHNNDEVRAVDNWNQALDPFRVPDNGPHASKSGLQAEPGGSSLQASQAASTQSQIARSRFCAPTLDILSGEQDIRVS